MDCVQGASCLVQFPNSTCIRSTVDILSSGLHPWRFVGDTMYPGRLWKWTFKSKDKADRLINGAASNCFSLVSPGRIPRHNNPICLVSAKVIPLKVIWQSYFDPHGKSLIYICICSPHGQTFWKNKKIVPLASCALFRKSKQFHLCQVVMGATGLPSVLPSWNLSGRGKAGSHSSDWYFIS
jgi:hypothetical protein